MKLPQHAEEAVVFLRRSVFTGHYADRVPFVQQAPKASLFLM